MSPALDGVSRPVNLDFTEDQQAAGTALPMLARGGSYMLDAPAEGAADFKPHSRFAWPRVAFDFRRRRLLLSVSY